MVKVFLTSILFDMVDDNFNKTQYSKYAKQYLEANREGTIGGNTPDQRVAMLAQYLPTGRRIFEIGSGGGDDALALQRAGYSVTASDFVEEFVKIEKERGLNATFFDAKRDEFPDTDALYANAVFVHFTPEEVTDCLRRMKNKLRNEKIIFISVIKGEGQERSARGRGFERDFYYYSARSMTEILQKEGYEIIFTDDHDPKWLQVISRAL